MKSVNANFGRTDTTVDIAALVVVGVVVAGCLVFFTWAALRRAGGKIDIILTEEVGQVSDDAPVETLPVTQEDEANARTLLKQTYDVTDEVELQTAIVDSRLTDRVLPGDFPNTEAYWAEVEAIAGVPSDAKLWEELDTIDPNLVPGYLWARRNEGTLPRWAAPLVTDQILTEFYTELNFRAATTR